MSKVKITKVALDDRDQPMYEVITTEGGNKERGKQLQEDIIGEIVHWGKKAFTTDTDMIVYETVVYIRRWDDGTIEEARPEEIMYLDDYNGPKTGDSSPTSD